MVGRSIIGRRTGVPTSIPILRANPPTPTPHLHLQCRIYHSFLTDGKNMPPHRHPPPWRWKLSESRRWKWLTKCWKRILCEKRRRLRIQGSCFRPLRLRLPPTTRSTRGHEPSPFFLKCFPFDSTGVDLIGIDLRDIYPCSCSLARV